MQQNIKTKTWPEWKISPLMTRYDTMCPNSQNYALSATNNEWEKQTLTSHTWTPPVDGTSPRDEIIIPWNSDFIDATLCLAPKCDPVFYLIHRLLVSQTSNDGIRSDAPLSTPRLIYDKNFKVSWMLIFLSQGCHPTSNFSPFILVTIPLLVYCLSF